MSPASLGKTERARRERDIRAGRWDETWIRLDDGRDIWAHRTTLGTSGQAIFWDRDGQSALMVDLASVIKVVH